MASHYRRATSSPWTHWCWVRTRVLTIRVAPLRRLRIYCVPTAPTGQCADDAI